MVDSPAEWLIRLDAAEVQFDAFVTTDQNLRYQQNLAGRRLAILVLPFASWPKLQSHVATIVSAVAGLKPGRVPFTLDQDSLEIAALSQANQRRFAGIVVLGRDPALDRDAVKDLELILQALSSEELESRVIWIPL